jgi:hypothetical protein
MLQQILEAQVLFLGADVLEYLILLHFLLDLRAFCFTDRLLLGWRFLLFLFLLWFI